MALMQASVPGMKERSWGRVIHIASIIAGWNAHSSIEAAMARASVEPWGTINHHSQQHRSGDRGTGFPVTAVAICFPRGMVKSWLTVRPDCSAVPGFNGYPSTATT